MISFFCLKKIKPFLLSRIFIWNGIEDIYYGKKTAMV